jgi:hypothetical protein
MVVRMSGIARLGQLPTYELPAAGGGRVRSWDYKSRRHLVLWLAGPAPDRRALAAVAAREPQVQPPVDGPGPYLLSWQA